MFSIDIFSESEGVMKEQSEHNAIDGFAHKLFSSLADLSPDCLHQRIYNFNLGLCVHSFNYFLESITEKFVFGLDYQFTLFCLQFLRYQPVNVLATILSVGVCKFINKIKKLGLKIEIVGDKFEKGLFGSGKQLLLKQLDEEDGKDDVGYIFVEMDRYDEPSHVQSLPEETLFLHFDKKYDVDFLLEFGHFSCFVIDVFISLSSSDILTGLSQSFESYGYFINIVIVNAQNFFLCERIYQHLNLHRCWVVAHEKGVPYFEFI